MPSLSRCSADPAKPSPKYRLRCVARTSQHMTSSNSQLTSFFSSSISSWISLSPTLRPSRTRSAVDLDLDLLDLFAPRAEEPRLDWTHHFEFDAKLIDTASGDVVARALVSRSDRGEGSSSRLCLASDDMLRVGDVEMGWRTCRAVGQPLCWGLSSN